MLGVFPKDASKVPSIVVEVITNKLSQRMGQLYGSCIEAYIEQT